MHSRLCIGLALLVLLAQLGVVHAVVDSIPEDLLCLMSQDMYV
jgi:hypothetical protein